MMSLKLFLELMFNVTIGMIFAVGCAFLVNLAVVYAYKYATSLIKDADKNIVAFRNVKIFKDEKQKRKNVGC